jgi:hypothetical protein
MGMHCTLGGLILAVVLAMAGLTTIGSRAHAQEGPGGAINPNRDCQTLLTCNFRRNGQVRGCLSSYSCRQCRFVKSRCSVGNRRGNCRRLVCDWGA